MVVPFWVVKVVVSRYERGGNAIFGVRDLNFWLVTVQGGRRRRGNDRPRQDQKMSIFNCVKDIEGRELCREYVNKHSLGQSGAIIWFVTRHIDIQCIQMADIA